MNFQASTTEQRLQRFMELINERLDEEVENKERKKNKNFVQMYGKGFDRVISIIEEYPLGAKIYMFLAKHIEPGTGAVIASQQLLADELGISVRSVQRGTKWLDEKNIVLRLKLGAGSIYAYCLDPSEVWKSWNSGKKYAAFNTKTLARYEDNGDIKRRLMIMLKGKSEFNLEDKTIENNEKENKSSKTSEFSQEIKDLSRKYDIPLEKVEILIKDKILNLDKQNSKSQN